MLKTSVALTLAGLTLVGCSGSATTSAPKVTSPADLPALVKCANYSQDDEPQLFSTGSGYCERDGTTVYLATFSTSTDRDQWVKVASSTTGGVYVIGDGWVAAVENDEVARSIAADSGGKVSQR